MRALVLVLVLSLALAACGGKGKPSTLASTTTAQAARSPVTAEALTTFFTTRFAGAVQEGLLSPDFGSGGVDDDVIRELAAMGVSDLSGVQALIPADFDTKGLGAIRASSSGTTTIAGVLRDLMIMRDTRGYFEKAWNHGWTSSGPEDFPVPAAYGVDFSIMVELGVFDEGGGDPCGDPCGGGWEGDPCGGYVGDPCGE